MGVISHDITFSNIRVLVCFTKISSGLGGVPSQWKREVRIDQ